MNKLKINTWTGIFDIVACLLFASSWFVIFATAFSDAANKTNATSGAGIFFYAVAWIGVVLNAIALWQSYKHNISLVGGILGVIGCVCFGLTALLAFPAIILLIIAVVFLFLQHPRKKENVA
ncbi:transporter [Lacticaseibacillus zeae]|uniref:Transporter n=1 Tax=Lacticaseibacillus zeae TaxID=57037 RepID=A0A5R8LQA8_LACZE|nr:transporter [Lacticaseibacillus zeae]TLF39320.1 transporter [Lacticaseibacillus zeae]